MPRVYTGKVLIPGDHIEAYFAAMKEAEEARAPFRQSLEALNEDFGAFLVTKYTTKTVRQHTGTIALFIDFLCDYTDVERLEDVTRGMINSQFRACAGASAAWAVGGGVRGVSDETSVARRSATTIHRS